LGGEQNLLAIESSGPTRLKAKVRVLKQWTSRLPKLFPNLPQRPLLNYGNAVAENKNTAYDELENDAQNLLEYQLLNAFECLETINILN